MISNAPLVVLLGLLFTSVIVYAIMPMPITQNTFIGMSILCFTYCLYLKYSEMNSRSKNEPLLIPGAHDGKKKLVLKANKFKMSNKNYEYSMSFWFKINGWNHRYGNQKVLLNRGNSPKIYLDNFKPQLVINQAVYNPLEESVGKTERIIVDTVPVQKWVHFFMIIKNKRVSVFLNGKLVKGYVLTNMPWIQKGKMIVSDEQGFDGIIAHLKYYNRSATYDDVSWEYNINNPK